MRIKAEIDGLDDIFRAAAALKRAAGNRVVRRMVNAGSTIILRSTRAKIPTRTKQLRKSWGRKTKTYASSGRVVSIIGPRTGFKVQVGVRKRGKNAGKPVYHDPAKVAHLAEFGHGGPSPAPAHPFARPGYDESKGAARARMLQVGAEALESEARKAAKR